MKEVKRVLGTRIMIKKLDGKRETASGLTIEDDGESLPLATVVMVSDEITQVEVGDTIHYTVARESGKCRHKGEEHYIISIANAVAITDESNL